jgi:hypothetical protein
MSSHQLYLASALDAAAVIGGLHHPHEGIPPAGTELRQVPAGDVIELIPPISGLALPFVIDGTATEGGPDDWWHDTLVNFAGTVGLDHLALYARLASLFDDVFGGLAGPIDQWPVIVKGTRGTPVRWIRHTLRGTLNGGIEQFQHKMDWGVPGDDPDITEAEGEALAVTLATAWKDSWVGSPELWSPDVKYTESGIVQLTQTESVDKHGVGPHPEESFGTTWYMWPVGSEPVGTAAALSLPFEVSLAVTLQTDHRGPSGRGRAYLPPPAVSQITAHGVFGSSAKAMSYVLCQYVMAGIAATPYLPVVVSRRRLILNEITSINSGKVPDSQRRRRRSQDEARTTDWTSAGGLV